MKRLYLPLTVFVVLFLSGLTIYFVNQKQISNKSKIENTQKNNIVLSTFSNPSPIPIPASPSATPKALSFAELNSQFGPCVRLPILFYHHIQTKDSATSKHQLSLSVFTPIFQDQMQYLKNKGYNVVSMAVLSGFFDSGTSIPARSVIITFDDAYQDFNTDAYPILQSLGFSSTVFVPTGLVDNPDYLTWSEILSMGNVLFANHTWSHKNVGVSVPVMQKEVSTADQQLAEKNLNNPKVFAYPYGLTSPNAESYLQSLGYKLAFTTKPGNILCKGKRLELPRVRVGNVSLASYGF